MTEEIEKVNSDIQEKTSESKENVVVRDEKGRVVSGTPNPYGRPKGAGVSITTEIKRKLEEVPEGQKATYLQLLVNRIMKQAIADGDQAMIGRIWNYIDGMPKQTIKNEFEDAVTDIEFKLVKSKDDIQSNSNNSIPKEPRSV